VSYETYILTKRDQA